MKSVEPHLQVHERALQGDFLLALLKVGGACGNTFKFLLQLLATVPALVSFPNPLCMPKCIMTIMHLTEFNLTALAVGPINCAMVTATHPSLVVCAETTKVSLAHCSRVQVFNFFLFLCPSSASTAPA